MNAYDEHRAQCRPCRVLQPKWAPSDQKDPPPAPTPFRLLDGLAEEIQRCAQRAGAAQGEVDQCGPGSQEHDHARGFLQQALSEQRHWEAQRRKWRSWIDAHPELAQAPISTRCKHPREIGGLPTCYDGETGLYVADAADEL